MKVIFFSFLLLLVLSLVICSDESNDDYTALQDLENSNDANEEEHHLDKRGLRKKFKKKWKKYRGKVEKALKKAAEAAAKAKLASVLASGKK